MSKRNMSKNSLKNLEKGKPFTANCKEIARKAQEKSVEKRIENKLLKQVAEEMLNKEIEGITFQEVSINRLIEYVTSGDAKPEIIIKILEFLRDTSGQKPTDKLTKGNGIVITVAGQHEKEMLEQIQNANL